MTRTLLLIRHAKAVQGGTSDEARTLAERGEADARVAGTWLADHDLAPAHVVVSPARRAQQTWEGMASGLATAPSRETDRRIYDSSVESLLGVIHDLPEVYERVALVGHNPSMHELAVTLYDGAGDPAARAAIASSYPTNGIAVLTVENGWDSVGPGAARLQTFVAPRA